MTLPVPATGTPGVEPPQRVSIGSNTTIMPVSICDGAVIGAGAVVTRDIVEPGVYAGNPARKIHSLSTLPQSPSID